MREIPINYLTEDVFIDVISDENTAGYTVDDLDTAVMNTFLSLQSNT